MNATDLRKLDRPALCLPRELVASPVFLLASVGVAAKLQAMDAYEEAGFSPYHYGVLALLDEGSRETQATIADALKVDRSQLVGLLDALESRELVERRRDPNDRRRHLVSLTPAGKKELGKLRKVVAQLEEDLLAPLDADERAQLHSLLHRVARHRDARYDPS
jgi:MarR family transcriptional regulator, lower aerobic nicotinate degradation pathway regulator